MATGLRFLLPVALVALLLLAGPRALVSPAAAQFMPGAGYGNGTPGQMNGLNGPSGAMNPGGNGMNGTGMGGLNPPTMPNMPTPGLKHKPLEDAAVYTLDPTMPMVVDVRVEGLSDNKMVDRIRPMVRTRKGRQLDPRLVEEDVRRLHASKMFLDVRPVYKTVPGGVILFFQVIERATLKYVKFQGNQKVKNRTLAKQAGIKKGDAADPYAVEDAREKLEQWLHEKGHAKATVTILEGNKTGDAGAIFQVHEGPIQRVGTIAFEGNTIAPDGRLATLIQTKRPILMIPKVFPGFKGYAERDKVDGDVDTLTAYYRGLGYFQAKVAPEVYYDDDQAWATVRFVVSEGIRYKVRNIAFHGNTKRTNDELQKPLKLVSGDYFVQDKLNADKTSIEEQYGTRGYLFCNVQAEPTFLEQPGELDITYKISEGAKCRIGRINVHVGGDDPHTRRMTVLNRLDFRPGDIADIRKIRDSERRLRASGIFMTDPQQGEPPKIVFRTPGGEEESDSYAEKPKGPGRFRGQSPDSVLIDGPVAIEPGEQLVELQVLPDNQLRVVSLAIPRPALAAPTSWQTARPTSGGLHP